MRTLVLILFGGLVLIGAVGNRTLKPSDLKMITAVAKKAKGNSNG